MRYFKILSQFEHFKHNFRSFICPEFCFIVHFFFVAENKMKCSFEILDIRLHM